jgi:hypothetical protein
MAEASQESQELPAGESSTEKPSDQREGLDSVSELSEPTVPSQQEAVSGSHLEVLPSTPVEVREQSIRGPLSDESSELKQMLSGIITAVQESHTRSQESVKADISSANADLSANNESIQQFQESVRADLITNQDSVRADLSANQERVIADINSISNDIKAENEKLIKKFELQNQEAKKEFAAKLDSEARRLTSFVGQVQK